MIQIRPLKAADAEELFPLIHAHPEVTGTLVWNGPDSLDEFRAALSAQEKMTAVGEKFFFTIDETNSGRPVGSIALRPYEDYSRADIGIWLGAPFQGLGYGTQAVQQVLAYGFDQLGMHKIESYIFVGNHASRRIFEKNGFQLEGTIRNAVHKQGLFKDEWLLGITRRDYFAESGRMDWIVHLLSRRNWETAQSRGDYRAASLATEGFIHFSLPAQVQTVANTFYRELPDPVLLWVDPNRLASELRWEAVERQLFPHLYGPLNLDAVLAVNTPGRDAKGAYREIDIPATDTEL